jgi:serine/threonine protein phosphatase PrpC
MVTVAVRTHVGAVRSHNEDAVAWDPDLSLAVVADGMGGHNAGEVASKLAIDSVRAFMRDSAADPDKTWPFGVDASMSVAANRLRNAVKIANVRVFHAAEERAEYAGMGTTLVVGLLDGARLTFTSVGDTRIYSLAKSDFGQLTQDDSWIAMLTKESGLDAAAFENHPMRHVITKVVGAQADVEVTVQQIDLVDGQVVILCTDGLYGEAGDDTVRTTLEAEPDLERAADALVARALDHGGHDKISVLLIRYTR